MTAFQYHSSDVIPPTGDESLLAVIRRLSARKDILFIGSAAGLLLSLVLILLMRPQYEASMIVAPAGHDSRTDSFVEGVFVYAPEVEAKIPTGSPDFIRFEQSLRGANVASLLFRMDGIAAKIEEDGLWRGIHGQISTPEELSRYLTDRIDIETLGATASRKITYRHPDPEFAVKLLTILRKADDQIIRTSVKTETELKIEWLKSQFKKTLNPDHRQALSQLLLTEERRQMLLSLETPYAVSVVEEAASSPRPVSPNKPLLLSVGVFIGLVAASAFILSRRESES